MRSYLLCLFLLLQALSFAYADAQFAADSDQGEDAKGDRFRADIVSAQSSGQSAREPGADLFDAAVTELRKIHQHPLHHHSRKKLGVFGTVLRWVSTAIPTFQLSTPPVNAPKSVLAGPLLHAVRLLEESSQKNNSDAFYVLAELNFYGNFSHPRNFPLAFEYYQRLAALNGNSSALHMLGFMYSTGVGGAVERDQAKALLYYTFAASRGHTRAEMTVAYRHHGGIGTPKSCDTAVKYYKRVADKAIAWYRSGPPGGMGWIPEAYRIADDAGGIYGAGASVSSAGSNAIKAHPNSDALASIEDIIEYLDLMSQKGDFKATFNLGRIYYDGQRGLDHNFDLARKYFFAVTQRFWKKGRVVENFKPGLDKTAGKAAGYIGRMFLRGEGIDQSFERAKFWFDRGIAHGDAQSQYGMGLMLLNGYGVSRNVPRATDLFKAAADQDFSLAQVQLGTLYLDQGHADDLGAASHYFELAARYGNIEAYYYLAELNLAGVGRDKSCSVAVSFYKSVAERAEPLVSSWAEANLAYEDGDRELAFLEYLGAAEQGYEKAQTNVAFMLDSDNSQLSFLSLIYQSAPRPALLQNPTLALIFWTRSSRQGNIDSLVKMGDYYLHGIGTDLDVDKAVQCFSGASEFQQSAQALYNLGWMHENGVGLNQDYHLAKRYYDSALETNEEAYLPVTLSLLKLRARSAWNTLTHGRINSIQDEPAPKKDWSIAEWVANFLQDDNYYFDDLYDDLYDDTIGEAGLDDLDEAILESLLIFGLAAALVVLLLYRQQRQQAARRQEEERQRQEQGRRGAAVQGNPAVDRGVFPQPGDPNFLQWGAGGVGH